jgi:hypothetical protein
MAGTGKSKTCVWRWQERFMTEGVDGLLREKTRPVSSRLAVDQQLPRGAIEDVMQRQILNPVRQVSGVQLEVDQRDASLAAGLALKQVGAPFGIAAQVQYGAKSECGQLANLRRVGLVGPPHAVIDPVHVAPDFSQRPVIEHQHVDHRAALERRLIIATGPALFPAAVPAHPRFAAGAAHGFASGRRYFRNRTIWTFPVAKPRAILHIFCGRRKDHGAGAGNGMKHLAIAAVAEQPPWTAFSTRPTRSTLWDRT